MAFHIPSSQEFVDLKSVMYRLGLTTADDYRVKLHMPFAGNRTPSAVLNNQGTRGNYWSHYPYASNNAYYLALYSSYVYYDLTAARASAFSVRCFADEYVEPDSTWTVVAGSLGSAGIFYNATLGIISVTNGSNKNFTIKDKNEGATVVYNDGDELTQANMGNLYQRGNYYGFPSTGDVSSTSSTRVDTTGYGNGVPYSSSTFITGNDDWSNPSNTNLWAGSSDEYFQDSSTTKIYVNVYNKSGTSILHTFLVATDSTVNTLLTSGLISGVTALSDTINGTALSTDTVLVDGTSYYDVTPVTPPTPTGAYITKVYHNNQAYNVGGVVVEGQEVVYLTQAEYDALPASKLTDGKIYKIKTSGSVPTPVSISDTLMFNVGTVQCLSSDNEMYIIPSKQALKRGTMEKINATASYGPGAIVGNYFYVKNSSSSPTIAKIDLGTLETETITITGITATNIKQIFGEWDYLYFVDTTSDKVWGYSLNTQEVTLLNDQLDLNNVEFVKNGILYNLEGDVLVGYDTNNNFEIADRIPFYNGVPLLSGNDIYAVISEGNGSTNGLNVIQKVYTFNS